MMKKVTIASFLFSSFSFFAQQIGNSNMELWDNVGQPTEEPTNWNSFKSATGGLSSFGSKQVQRSTSIRSGASGVYCARVWSLSTPLGVIANGNLTLGQINMGSSTPSSSSNYNFSKTTDPNFSEALTSSPDSLVFWVKYTAANANDSARVHAILHDNYDLRDPVDANSASHIVATAERNYVRTNGSWTRISVPFNYVVGSPAPTPSYILVTFTTNKTPGGGSNNDEVLIDDIELIYNSSVSITENKSESFYVNYNISSGLEIFCHETNINVVDSRGVIIKNGKPEDLKGLILTSGLYFVQAPTKTVKVLVP